MKKCMLLAVSELCPEKMRIFQNISLSRMNVQSWVADIAANLTDQLKQKVKNSAFIYWLWMKVSIVVIHSPCHIYSRR